MKKLLLMFLFVLLMAPVSSVLALEPPPGEGVGTADSAQIGKAQSYTGAQFGDIFVNLVDWFAWFIALVAVVMGLYSGFLFITGGGDDAKISKAKQIFVYAMIGIVVAILSFSIVAIAQLFTDL